MIKGLRSNSNLKWLLQIVGEVHKKSKQIQNLKMYSHDTVIFKFLKGFQVEEINFLLSPPKDSTKTDKNNGEEDYCKLERLLLSTSRW